MKQSKRIVGIFSHLLILGFQICILAWMGAYSLYARNYTPDKHEEERKRIIESVEKELKNQTGSRIYTGDYIRTTERVITNNSTTNQKQKGNAVIVKVKGPNSVIPVLKSSTGASVDTQKTGIIPPSVKKECGKDCKIQVLVKNGINETIAKTLVNECKKQDKQVVNCIKLGASISMAESGGGTNCSLNNNCMGFKLKKSRMEFFKKQGFSFETKEDWVIFWVHQFGRLWYKQNTPSSFYSDTQKRIPITSYCKSEDSSGSEGFCPNGYKHSWAFFNSITEF